MSKIWGDRLTLKSFSTDDTYQVGTSFLLANGHLGYRGTLSEDKKDQMVALNLCGVYDQYENKWRESINLYNPLYIEIRYHDQVLTPRNASLKHELALSLLKAELNRHTDFDAGTIISRRFVSISDDQVLGEFFSFRAKKTDQYEVTFGVDKEVYEINGPHLETVSCAAKTDHHLLIIESIMKTKECKQIIKMRTIYTCSHEISSADVINNDVFIGVKTLFELKQNEVMKVDIMSRIIISSDNDFPSKENLNESYKQHIREFEALFKRSRILLDGTKEAQFAIDFCVYSLLILGSKTRTTSIPARGLSGQVYKGAVFWDTEIFMLPFFLLNNLDIARNLLIYRYDGLEGALKKSKRFGYDGAFYAWESQENGFEACSLYNVTDAKTGQPIRTYFADKQIHISADVLYGFLSYYQATKDLDFLKRYCFRIFIEVYKFYRSYSTFDVITGQYHFNDVIGPDEYHERVNDNAFTNYLIYFTLRELLGIFDTGDNNSCFAAEKEITPVMIRSFLESIYLPKPNQDGIIEQFAGYFLLEAVTPEVLKTRMETQNEYWGKKASLTKVIKQADVVTLLALFKDQFSSKIKQANYEYYLPYTEHGSSLSSSMYALLAADIGKSDDSYRLWLKSAQIDLRGTSKMFAGGIFIGGSHPAAAGGGILTLLHGYSGLVAKDGKYSFSNNLPQEIKKLSFRIKTAKKNRLIKIS
ncbi:MAG: hypothetical protein LBR37_01130 [Erysipelotrichaceae bacterium]|jgi:trehalose/maltose hydrolase-like predicted phosphorylase|nr:hypothetical protein [Erysipelotrichaceae bacterium]